METRKNEQTKKRGGDPQGVTKLLSMAVSSVRIMAMTVFIFFTGCVTLLAQSQIGHYVPGIFSTRDFLMPAPGFYATMHMYNYSSNRINNANGEKLSQVTIPSPAGGGITVPANVNAYVNMIAPRLTWVSDVRVFGGKFGAALSPVLGSTSIGASLSGASSTGETTAAGTPGAGDIFVQPLFLGWNMCHWDVSAGYGFYAPTGKYSTGYYSSESESIKVERPGNIGQGFWTHQLQGAVTWYPWSDGRIAVSNAITYEMNGKKKGFDLKPGSVLSNNWGISAMMPLCESVSMEFGPSGYSSWQTSDDTGSDALNPQARDQVHAAGGQIGITQHAWNASLNFTCFYEFAATDRYQGRSAGLNLSIRF